jgi:hypothetical protein
MRQVSILQDLLNVEVLSLSVNRIASLHFFAYCECPLRPARKRAKRERATTSAGTKLQELYLRKNSVSNLDEVTSA